MEKQNIYVAELFRVNISRCSSSETSTFRVKTIVFVKRVAGITVTKLIQVLRAPVST